MRLVVVVIALWLLKAFGLMGSLDHMRIGRG